MRKHLAAASIGLLMALPLAAQAPNTNERQELLALAKDVQAQQNQIVDNQGKIETKLNEIAENIRVARIFSQRSK